MNTIIYLYHSREITKFMTEKWQEEDYCLIRLGVPCLLWKNLKRAEENGKTASQEPISSAKQASPVLRKCDGEDMPEGKKQSLWHRWQCIWGRKRLRQQSAAQSVRQKQQDGVAQTKALSRSEEAEELRQLLCRITELMEELKELQIALCLLGNNPCWTYCVYEDYLWERIDTACWRQNWVIPEFTDYREAVWVRKLMQNTVPGQYMLLGYADCLPEILCENAARLRSVKWLLPEREYTQKVQQFAEDFYEEYGLVMDIRLLHEEWVRVRPESVVPVNVLDFTGEEKISACDVADGSIWLDMDSVDGKNRRMETRKPGVSYFSLKKLWKQRQKQAFCLDTLSKNGYNT